MKWMNKMVVVVKCQFLVTLIGKLHHFTFIDPIKIHKEIKLLSKLKLVEQSACLHLSLLKFDSLSKMSSNEGHFAVM